MPKYDFVCNACQKAYEISMTMKERATLKPRCPVCGSEDVSQQYGEVGFCGVKGGALSCLGGNCSTCCGCS